MENWTLYSFGNFIHVSAWLEFWNQELSKKFKCTLFTTDGDLNSLTSIFSFAFSSCSYSLHGFRISTHSKRLLDSYCTIVLGCWTNSGWPKTFNNLLRYLSRSGRSETVSPSRSSPTSKTSTSGSWPEPSKLCSRVLLAQNFSFFITFFAFRFSSRDISFFTFYQNLCLTTFWKSAIPTKSNFSWSHLWFKKRSNVQFLDLSQFSAARLKFRNGGRGLFLIKWKKK